MSESKGVDLSFKFFVGIFNPFAADIGGLFLLLIILLAKKLIAFFKLLLQLFKSIVSVPQHLLDFDDAFLQIPVHFPFHFDFIQHSLPIFLLFSPIVSGILPGFAASFN